MCHYRNLQLPRPRAQTRQNTPRNFIHPEPVVESLNRSLHQAAEDGQVRLRVGHGQIASQRHVWQTMEIVRQRVNLRLIVDSDKLLKAAVGFSIFELSKLLMYTFCYDHLKAEYGNRCTLLFTDTDSLCCHIQTPNLYEDMKVDSNEYDTSNFEKDYPFYSIANHRVLGKFKSETGYLAPREFIGLMAKMYSLDCGKNHR